MAGNTYGNCGKDSQGRYVKCDKRWVPWGVLYPPPAVLGGSHLSLQASALGAALFCTPGSHQALPGLCPHRCWEVGLGDLMVFSKLNDPVILLSHHERLPTQPDGKSKTVSEGDLGVCAPRCSHLFWDVRASRSPGYSLHHFSVLSMI